MKGSPYIELLKYTLTDYHWMDQAEYRPLASVKPSMKTKLLSKLDKVKNFPQEAISSSMTGELSRLASRRLRIFANKTTSGKK